MWLSFRPPTSKGSQRGVFRPRGTRQRGIVAELKKQGEMFLGYLFFRYLYWFQHKNYMTFPFVKPMPSSKVHVGFRLQLILFFFFNLLIYFERGARKERMSREGAERERERENPKQ